MHFEVPADCISCTNCSILHLEVLWEIDIYVVGAGNPEAICYGYSISSAAVYMDYRVCFASTPLIGDEVGIVCGGDCCVTERGDVDVKAEGDLCVSVWEILVNKIFVYGVSEAVVDGVEGNYFSDFTIEIIVCLRSCAVCSIVCTYKETS